MELKNNHLKGINKGDRQAFLTLFDSFFIALCIYARKFDLDRDQAEDVVQEVMCRLYEKRQWFESITSLKTYLYTSVRNSSLNYIRSEGRRLNREDLFLKNVQDNRTFFDEMIENEVYRQLRLLLQELPSQCRLVFERTLEGETSEQIARSMNLSIETVKTHRKNAKRILRERYQMLYRIFGILFIESI